LLNSLRRFFGLPDVHPLQQEMLDKIREKMLAGMDGFDPATLMKPFLPESMHSLEALQRQFWQGLAQSATMATSAGKKAAEAKTGNKTKKD
jgi:microcystin-dependent protein